MIIATSLRSVSPQHNRRLERPNDLAHELIPCRLLHTQARLHIHREAHGVTWSDSQWSRREQR